MRARWLIVALVLGCGGGGKLTLRESCQAIAEAACDKQDECSPPVAATCVSDLVQLCCSGGSCDVEIPDANAQDQLDQCIADFETLSCQAVDEGQFPESCD